MKALLILKGDKYLQGLALLILTAVVFNIIWIVKDQSPPLWDMAALWD